MLRRLARQPANQPGVPDLRGGPSRAREELAFRARWCRRVEEGVLGDVEGGRGECDWTPQRLETGSEAPLEAARRRSSSSAACMERGCGGGARPATETLKSAP